MNARLLGALLLPCLLLVSFPTATQEAATPSAATEPTTFTLPNVFHIVGVPGVGRNDRGDLIFTASEVTFKDGKGRSWVIPYARIGRVDVLSGERYYAKSAAAVSAVSPIAGAILAGKKRKVDTLVFDYRNERGGQMGMVIQVPEKQGASCKQWLTRYGVTVAEPEPEPAKEPGPPPGRE